jgi:cell division protease FtsH
MSGSEKTPRPDPGIRRSKGIVVLLLIAVGVLLMMQYGGGQLAGDGETLKLSELEDRLRKGEVKSIKVEASEITGDLVQGDKARTFKVNVPDGYFRESDHLEKLKKDYVDGFKAKGHPGEPSFEYNPPNVWSQVAISLIPWLLLFFLAWFLLFRQMRASGPGSVLTFGRTRARMSKGGRDRVTFDDVAGCDEAKEEVKEVVEFLKDPVRFQKLGARMPHGVLLVGPPGTGKTLLARAVAGEADVPFYSIGGSDFVEMFVGVGASRVRDLFRQAKENSPSIIFLDEIDAVGRKRGSGLGGGHDEREQTLNAILVEMDGFDTDDAVIVMAATNRPDVLDPALLRPGRFDREIALDLPDVKGREEILRVHVKKVRLGRDVDLTRLARATPAFSGADLEALINEAALLAVLKRKDSVEMDDLEEARDKVRWGRAKRSKVMELEDKKITAYHEAGHAVVAALLPDAEPIHKVTIIPRGMMGGATMFLPEKDRHHLSKNYLLAMLKVSFAGRLAEEEFCGDISAGAQNDIKQATEYARMMVCEWGMSDLGPINYSESEETLFLGREVTRTRNHSEATAVAIDVEVKKILTQCYDAAKVILQANKEKVERVAKGLLRYESLDKAEVFRLLEGAEIETLKPAVKIEAAPAGPKAAGPAV